MVHTRFYHKTFTEDGGKYNLCFEGKKYLKIRLHVENIYILMILFDHLLICIFLSERRHYKLFHAISRDLRISYWVLVYFILPFPDNFLSTTVDFFNNWQINWRYLLKTFYFFFLVPFFPKSFSLWNEEKTWPLFCLVVMLTYKKLLQYSSLLYFTTSLLSRII